MEVVLKLQFENALLLKSSKLIKFCEIYKMATLIKGCRPSFYIAFLVFWIIIVVTIFESYDTRVSFTTQRKAAEHFFFDLLPMYDPEPSQFNYDPIPRTRSSAFQVHIHSSLK